MEKPWLQYYPEGIPEFIHPERYTSLNELLAEAFDCYSERIAFKSLGTSLSYQTLAEKSRDFSAFLQDLGLGKGARVAIMLPNILQYPVALIGVLRAGMIAVNTNPLYTPDELVHQLGDAEAEAIIIFAKYAEVLKKALPQLPKLKHIILSGMIISSLARYYLDRRFHNPLPKAIPFKHALKTGQQKPLQPVDIQAQDIAFLQYTGGTTGLSKAAMLSHRNMVANVLQATTWISPKKFGPEDLIITALPLYHIFSLTANCLSFLHLGVSNVLIIDARDTLGLIKQIHKNPPTAFTGVNTLFASLLNHPRFKAKDFANVKVALSGGMALSLSIAERWRTLVGSPLIEAYGLTEASPAVAINLLNQDTHQGSIGLPLPSTDIAIRDKEGKDCPQGEVGELCVQGPQVMLGYWQQKLETEKVFWADGFLRTGDSARMDEQGFIYLVDRIKDLIIVSGFNVYPNEVEQVIAHLEGIQEVAVIGVLKGDIEVVKACVVLANPKLSKKDILQHCRIHLTPYKIPKIIEFYSQLPKSNVGKVLRRMLK